MPLPSHRTGRHRAGPNPPTSIGVETGSGSSLWQLTPQDIPGIPSRFLAFRRNQQFALLQCAVSDLPHRMVSAPTGTGKTLLGISYALMMGLRTLVLVSTRALQDTIAEQFASAGIFDIRGHGNYPCVKAHEIEGETVWECGEKKSGCVWSQRLELAASKSLVLSNYANWFALRGFDNPLGQFDLVICDEAHLVHDLLVSAVAMKVDHDQVEDMIKVRPPSSAVHSDWRRWLNRARYETETRLDLMKLTRLDLPGRILQKQLRNLYTSIIRCGSIPESEWVVQYSEWTPSGRRKPTAILSPIWGYPFADDMLRADCSTGIYMSATLDYADHKYLGLDPDDVDYIEVPSEFPPARHPLTYAPSRNEVRLDSKASEAQVRELLRHADAIVTSRPDVKGIIHCQSYNWGKSFLAHSRNPTRYLLHDSGETADALRELISTKHPLVLVSPAIREGVDLPDDLCRLNLFLKVPFLDLRDPLTAARHKADPGYCDHVVSRAVRQGTGRGMRHKGDWQEGFILDAHWAWFQRKGKFSNEFKKTFRSARPGEIPAPLRVS